MVSVKHLQILKVKFIIVHLTLLQVMLIAQAANTNSFNLLVVEQIKGINTYYLEVVNICYFKVTRECINIKHNSKGVPLEISQVHTTIIPVDCTRNSPWAVALDCKSILVDFNN